MRLGIVGSEAAKFTEGTERDARFKIWALLTSARLLVTEVVSGDCHLGGIDVWAAEAGRRRGLKVTEFAPKVRNWSAPGGYKDRNMQIVENSDAVVCITVDRLPVGYTGMTFSHCYHCGTKDHVKSGGCWTVKQAVKAGKPGKIYTLPQWGD